MKAFESYINTKYPPKTKHLKFHVLFIPTPRDQLLSRLAEGKGDLAVAGLTVTPERQKIVDFSEPTTVAGISEIAVTGPQSPELHSLDDLSGKEVFLRQSSSYWEHMQKLNTRFQQEGKAPVTLRAAPEDLEDEDLLEMLNADLVQVVIVDDDVAKLWGGVYKNIRPHPEIAVNTGGQFAWAMRKDSPQLQAAVNDFLKTHRQGTAFGNTIIRKYVGGTQMIKNAKARNKPSWFGYCDLGRVEAPMKARAGTRKNYSNRSAITGSMADARRPGKYAASNAIVNSSSDTARIVGKSPGETPKSMLAISRFAASEHGMPSTTPNRASSIASRNTIQRMVFLCAPSAVRIPISLVRRVTV